MENFITSIELFAASKDLAVIVDKETKSRFFHEVKVCCQLE
jgi:hypothetical protein